MQSFRKCSSIIQHEGSNCFTVYTYISFAGKLLFLADEKLLTKEHTQQEKIAIRLASFTPVIIAYSLAGIVMVLFKKSRMFALGLLLAALILFALAFFLYPPETLLIF